MRWAYRALFFQIIEYYAKLLGELVSLVKKKSLLVWSFRDYLWDITEINS